MSTQAQSFQQSTLDSLSSKILAKIQPDRQSNFFEANLLDDGSVNIISTDQNAINQLKSKLPKGITTHEKLLPVVFANGKNYGIVNLSVSNHRAAAAQRSELVTQALLGTPVEILDTIDGYFICKTPDNYISYAEGAGIFPVTKAEQEKWNAAPKIIYNEKYGTAYSESSKKSMPVSDLVAGDLLEYFGKKGKFYEVKYPDGKTAFVSKKEAMPYAKWLKTRNPDFDHVLASAESLLGTPYLWGGTSTKGVDCSGFMRTSFFLNGIYLDRDASQQALNGESIDIQVNGKVDLEKAIKNLQKGDLMFFGTKRIDGSDKVTHVAMYIGDGKYIQATGFVKISSLYPDAPDYDAYHGSQFLSARRVFNKLGTKGLEYLK